MQLPLCPGDRYHSPATGSWIKLTTFSQILYRVIQASVLILHIYINYYDLCFTDSLGGGGSIPAE